MLNCELTFDTFIPGEAHQILVGYMLLEKKGKLHIDKCDINSMVQDKYHPYGVVEVKINNEIIVVYDTNDGYSKFTSFSQFDDILDHVDFYFKGDNKASFHINMKNKQKVYPLGPRYCVYTSGDVLNRIIWKDVFKLKITELKHLLWKIPYTKHAECDYYYQKFECEPNYNIKNPNVFFYTRLWDPSNSSVDSSYNEDLDGKTPNERWQTKRNEVMELSNLRAGLVRALKKEFGKSFIGGIKPEPYAIKNYPELIGNVNMSKRRDYTKNLHLGDICVNTRGTHNCWNFSFGEELAASKAIITQQPYYDVPHFLEEGINFLTYDNIDDCLAKAIQLYNDHDRIIKMMEANKNFYNNHLRPDMLVADTLDIACGKEWRI